MTSQSFTEQEITDIIQGLTTLIKRSKDRIANDERNLRFELDRVSGRKEKIERCKVLIDKLSVYKTPENIINYILANPNYETEKATLRT
jgi:hypothetical protein